MQYVRDGLMSSMKMNLPSNSRVRPLTYAERCGCSSKQKLLVMCHKQIRSACSYCCQLLTANIRSANTIFLSHQGRRNWDGSNFNRT